MNLASLTLVKPYPASSLFFAIRKAPVSAKAPLLALYTLHQKWREAAAYTDQHQAVTTLNWWHHELEKAFVGDISHPALLVLRPHLNPSLQGLLHGHMHWHHLTRIETPEQLQATIDAIGGSFVQVWLDILGQSDLTELSLAAGRALWWIDQIRHIGHSLTPSRLWLPMSWLKQANFPAHLILKRDANRGQHGQALLQQLNQTAQAALAAYQQQYQQLPNSIKPAIKSLHALMQQRALLLDEIIGQPSDVWTGLVSVGPRRKWWASIRA